MYGKVYLDYLKKGINVIPVDGKAAKFIKNWQKYSNEQIDSASARQWAYRFGNKNIGVVLGKASNLIALDIDTDDPEILDSVPKSPVAKKGKKGITYFFKYNGEETLRNHKLGIEILGTGAQTVIPPSIHPDINKSYYWIGKSLLEYDLDELPFLPENFRPFNNNNNNSTLFSGDNNVTIYDLRPETGRCKHNSHLYLSRCLMGIIYQEQLTPSEIVDEILDIDSEINPDVSYFACKTRPWKHYDRHLNAMEFVLEAYKRHKTDVNIVKRAKKQVQVKVEVKDNVAITEEEKATSKIKLPKMRGINKEIYDLCYKTMHKKRHKFAFASTFSLMGTLLSNKFSFRGVYTPFYTIILTHSGGGKDAPMRFIQDFLYKAGLVNYLGLSNPQSTRIIVENLPAQRVRVDLVDEINNLLKGVKRENSTTFAILGEYNKLYSSHGRFYLGLQASGYDKKVLGQVHSPAVSLFGATTPEGLKTSVNINMFKEGIGTRLLLIPDTNRVKLDLQASQDFNITDNLFEFLDTLELKTIIPDANVKPRTRELFISDKTNKKITEILNYFNDEEHFIYTRAIQNFYKFCIIDTIGRGKIEIDTSTIDWSLKATKSLLQLMAEYIEQYIHNDDKNEDLNNKILVYLKRLYNLKHNTIDAKHIYQHIYKIDKRFKRNEISEAINYLVDMNVLELSKINNKKIIKINKTLLTFKD